MSNENQKRQDENFDPERRNLLIGAGTLGLGTLAAAAMGPFAGTAFAAEKAKEGDGLVDAALDCLKKGQACIDHCLILFRQGDTKLAACAEKVTEMLVFCEALSYTASYKSPHLKKLAQVCIDVCDDCEKECRKHEKDHSICKECADACAACIKECKKSIG